MLTSQKKERKKNPPFTINVLGVSSCSLGSQYSVHQTTSLNCPFPGSIRFFFSDLLLHSYQLKPQSVLYFSPSEASVLPFSIPLVFILSCLHSQTMPCYSWLKVNWSDTISTVALAETEHDRSALSWTHTHTHTHTNTQTHTCLHGHSFGQDAAQSSLLLDISWSLKGT